MSRHACQAIFVGACIAGASCAVPALSFAAASPAYQAPARLRPADLVTVSGCVAQALRTGSLVTETSGTQPATPNTAGVEANSNEPVNAFLLLDATPFTTDSGKPRDAKTSYALQGGETELAIHRGHRVEIVGYPMPLPPGTSSRAGGAPQRIAVKSIKMLESLCSVPASQRGGK